jgi:hypothetical protein
VETKIKTRTDADFSKHELYVEKCDNYMMHHLKHPDYSHMYSVKFINTNGIMAVTGDYGNWIFCREFHPSAEGGVSTGYWQEKLTMASTQEGYEFDNDATKWEILEGLNGGLEEYGYTGSELEQAKEYYESLLEYVECSAWEYEAFAYNNFPGFMCSEDVPHMKKTKIWLNIVFDAFEEICRRMKD